MTEVPESAPLCDVSTVHDDMSHPQHDNQHDNHDIRKWSRNSRTYTTDSIGKEGFLKCIVWNCKKGFLKGKERLLKC